MSDEYEVGIVGEYDEGDALMSLHDASMCGQPLKAATARILKHFVPIIEGVLNEELARFGRDPAGDAATLVFACSEACRNLLNNMLINIVPAGAIATQFPMLADSFAEAMKRDGEEILRRVASGELGGNS